MPRWACHRRNPLWQAFFVVLKRNNERAFSGSGDQRGPTGRWRGYKHSASMMGTLRGRNGKRVGPGLPGGPNRETLYLTSSPRNPRQPGYKAATDQIESLPGVIVDVRRDQRMEIRSEGRIEFLLSEVPLELGATYFVNFSRAGTPVYAGQFHRATCKAWPEWDRRKSPRLLGTERGLARPGRHPPMEPCFAKKLCELSESQVRTQLYVGRNAPARMRNSIA